MRYSEKYFPSMYYVEIGKGKGGYKTKYSFSVFDPDGNGLNKARYYYTAINISRDFKKRLIEVNENGVVSILAKGVGI